MAGRASLIVSSLGVLYSVIGYFSRCEELFALFNDIVQFTEQFLHSLFIPLLIGQNHRANMGQAAQCLEVSATQIQKVSMEFAGRMGGSQRDNERPEKCRLARTGYSKDNGMTPT